MADEKRLGRRYLKQEVNLGAAFLKENTSLSECQKHTEGASKLATVR